MTDISNRLVQLCYCGDPARPSINHRKTIPCWAYQGHDRVDVGPVLRKPEEWAEIIGYRILDPDGWRMKGAPAWDDPITYRDFVWRFSMSTVGRILAKEDADG